MLRYITCNKKYIRGTIALSLESSGNCYSVSGNNYNPKASLL